MTREEFLKYQEDFCKRMVSICVAKNSDYSGASEDPFFNFSRVEALGIAGTASGILVRMTDKLCRISSILRKGNIAIASESIEDTLLDLANYASILSAYLSSPPQESRDAPNVPASEQKLTPDSPPIERMESALDALTRLRRLPDA